MTSHKFASPRSGRNRSPMPRARSYGWAKSRFLPLSLRGRVQARGISQPDLKENLKMTDYSDAFGGKYMNASHVTEPFVGTVERVELEDVDGNGKMKPVLHFVGRDRGCVLNATRYEMASQMAGSRDTDRWLGMKILVTRGKTRFAGKPTDCVEFGLPPAEKRKKAAAEVTAELDDVIPF